MDAVLADTGAKVSVCGVDTAKKWNLLERMTKSNVKIKPYKSTAIPTVGTSVCAVSFGDRASIWDLSNLSQSLKCGQDGRQAGDTGYPCGAR